MFLLSFFFFSSRRRHTRCGRDWSSDVCSSDLGRRRMAAGGAAGDPDRGGAQIPTPAPPRPRLSLPAAAAAPAVGAIVLTFGLAAYPAGTVHGALRTLLGLLGVGAAGLLVVGLLARSTAPLPWSIGLLGISAAVAM